MPVNENFCAQYRELLERMKALAEFDGDVFLPNPPPKEPVDYILVCMEPSLGWWAKSADEARARVDAGFRNFLFSPEDFILHFCAQRFLCGTGQRYFLTDLLSRADQKFPIRAEQKGTTVGEGKEDKSHDMGAAVA